VQPEQTRELGFGCYRRRRPLACTRTSRRLSLFRPHRYSVSEWCGSVCDANLRAVAAPTPLDAPVISTCVGTPMALINVAIASECCKNQLLTTSFRLEKIAEG
jgi:hypothetical protein